jgi:hypothetical protein
LEKKRNIIHRKNDKIQIANSKVILINEGQFFPDLLNFVNELLKYNKKIYICGLDGDFERKKFGQIIDLIPLCDKVEKLSLDMFKHNFDKMLMPISDFLRPAEECFFYDKDSNNLEIPLMSSAEDIYDFVRAWSFKDRPKPYFSVNGRKIYLSL